MSTILQPQQKSYFALGCGMILLVVLGLGLIVGLWGMSSYNRIVTANETVSTAWAQVENVLQRRNDLIPNLVSTVKGYAAHESGTLEAVTQARANIANAQTIPDKVTANNQLTNALSKLMMVVEAYPDLKANTNFMALQDELAGTENRIAVERKRYNDAVREYNLTVRRFPGSLVATIFGYARESKYFESTAEAKIAPKVDFAPAVPAPAALPAPTPAPVPVQ